MTYEHLHDADLMRIERCLPELHDDGEAGFAVILGQAGKRDAAEPEDNFDTEDVRRLLREVRYLRQRLDAIGGRYLSASDSRKAEKS